MPDQKFKTGDKVELKTACARGYHEAGLNGVILYYGHVRINNRNDCTDLDSWELIEESKNPPTTWSTTLTSSNGITVKKDVIEIDGTKYTIEQLKALQGKIRAALDKWKTL